jgi:hypothetical protein
MNSTRFSTVPSWRIARKRSKMMLAALAECSVRKRPTSRVSAQAISSESDVGFCWSVKRISSASSSCATD